MVLLEQIFAKMYLKNRILIYFLIVIFNNCTNKTNTLPFYTTPDFSPHFINNNDEIKSIVKHKIKQYQFLNQDSVIISTDSLKGKIHVANFIFTTCGSICPRMTDHLNIIGKKYETDKNIILISFTVMPWIDTPSVLKKYKINKGIKKSNWHFLTGNKSKIYKLARQSYFAEEKIGYTKDSLEFLHTEHLLLIDKDLRIRGIYNGTIKGEMYQLITDIEKLKNE